MLELVRLALRRTTSAFDAEIQMLIDDCISELESLGVINRPEHYDDPQIRTAVVAYCKWKFGNNPDADTWEHIYNDKVAKLMHKSGYGLRGESDGQF